jgi:hypothetical protein
MSEKITTGAVAQLSLVNGDVRWFKRDLAVNGMGPLACLKEGAGIIGCASYAMTSHVYKVKENGNVEYNYMFTGDNPETCLGIRQSASQMIYILLQSASSSYTSTGF